MILPGADGFLPVLFFFLPIMSVQGDPGAAISLSPPPSPPPYPHAPKFAPFKPSVAVVVGLLTTTFSITFLLLLYAKHWHRATNAYGGSPPTALSTSNNSKRKNSGVTRAVVDSLPVFRFASLAGPKEGLECAVCLSGFEPSDVLRLLPKCKHAFHVECVDTWLDAHSTCPLCRYRVDPEDVLLLLHDHSLPLNHLQSLPAAPSQDANIRTHRLSGRHSSAGERGTNKLLQIILQSSSTRRSLDSRAKPTKVVSHASTKKNPEASSSAGADQIARNNALSEKSRQDGLLLLASVDDRENFEKRFEHRIMISDNDDERQRWSDLHPSDLMYLRSEMIMNDSRRGYSSARGSPNHVAAAAAEAEDDRRSRSKEMSGGRIVNNPRSVSEITGGERRSKDDDDNGGNFESRRVRRNRRVAGVLSRWLAWVSTSSQRSQPVDYSLPL
uniref:RING-type E3 ubiquitin transferase n=1 Tax=Kalanchoe fedtschenkoi TaxID=63787 RepID=A0A7N0TID6_KALFE